MKSTSTASEDLRLLVCLFPVTPIPRSRLQDCSSIPSVALVPSSPDSEPDNSPYAPSLSVLAVRVKDLDDFFLMTLGRSVSGVPFFSALPILFILFDDFSRFILGRSAAYSSCERSYSAESWACKLRLDFPRLACGEVSSILPPSDSVDELFFKRRDDRLRSNTGRLLSTLSLLPCKSSISAEASSRISNNTPGRGDKVSAPVLLTGSGVGLVSLLFSGVWDFAIRLDSVENLSEFRSRDELLEPAGTISAMRPWRSRISC
mmetsp:Transcript_15464/g.23352  ORF Transcript_15464/g.23352 Transcript_15464/m.23352 type:complete len:261 (-) Transcript_15464:2458-3240(-)